MTRALHDKKPTMIQANPTIADSSSCLIASSNAFHIIRGYLDRMVCVTLVTLSQHPLNQLKRYKGWLIWMRHQGKVLEPLSYKLTFLGDLAIFLINLETVALKVARHFSKNFLLLKAMWFRIRNKSRDRFDQNIRNLQCANREKPSPLILY